MTNHVPEYLKIREYLLKIVAASDGSNLQAPTENELCGRFRVTRPTVRNAIRGLIADGYLIPRRGLGTFINPSMVDKHLVRTPKMGVISRCAGDALADIQRMVAMNGMDFEPVYMSDSEDPQRLIEILKSGFDSLLWFEPAPSCEPCLEAVKASGLPLLAIARGYEPPCDCIASPDVCNAGRVIAETLYAKGHDRFIYVHNSQTDDGRLSAGSWLDSCCNRLSELSGRPHAPKDHFAYLKDFHSLIKNWRTRKAPFTAIYSVARIAPQLAGMLAQEGVSIPEDVSFLSYMQPEEGFFGGAAPDFMDIATPMRKAFFLWHSLRLGKGDRSGVFRKQLEYRVVSGETLKNISSREGC